MSAFDRELRRFVRDIVRDEFKSIVAELARRDVYLSTEAAAEIASVHPDTIRRWLREGRLPEHRAGRELRVLRSDLERLLASPRRCDGDLSPEALALRDFG